MDPGTDHAEAPIRVPWKYAVDVAVWTVAAVIAYLLRIPDPWPPSTPFLIYLAINLPVTAVTIWAFGLPRQAWRQATIQDLLRLGEAVATGTAVMFVVGVVLYETRGFPRTVPLIAGALALIGMGAARLVLRLREEGARAQIGAGGSKRALIVGAGSARAWWPRDAPAPAAGLTPVGFLDDDPRKRGMTIARHAGARDDRRRWPRWSRRTSVDQVLIAMPSAPGRRTRQVVELAREAERSLPHPAGRHRDPARRRRATDPGARRAGRGPAAAHPGRARPGRPMATTWADAPCSSRAPAARSGRSSFGRSRGSTPSAWCCSVRARTACTRSSRSCAGRCPTSTRRWSSATCRTR